MNCDFEILQTKEYRIKGIARSHKPSISDWVVFTKSSKFYSKLIQSNTSYKMNKVSSYIIFDIL